jgi:hypothetical protein
LERLAGIPESGYGLDFTRTVVVSHVAGLADAVDCMVRIRG